MVSRREQAGYRIIFYVLGIFDFRLPTRLHHVPPKIRTSSIAFSL